MALAPSGEVKWPRFWCKLFDARNVLVDCMYLDSWLIPVRITTPIRRVELFDVRGPYHVLDGVIARGKVTGDATVKGGHIRLLAFERASAHVLQQLGLYNEHK